jgi:PilZ domain.
MPGVHEFDLIYLGNVHPYPFYLHKVKGFKVQTQANMESLRRAFADTSRRTVVLVGLDYCGRKQIDQLLERLPQSSSVTLIVVAQTFESTCYKVTLERSDLVLVREKEADSIQSILDRWANGERIYSRKKERIPVKTPVMVKKSALNIHSPAGSSILALAEGRMRDFSASGACLDIPALALAPKEFLNVIYMSQDGKWVSVECQLRWVQKTEEGRALVGVQFLAVSA